MPERLNARLWLERIWYERPVRPWLTPAAVLFAAITGLRRWLYRVGIFSSCHAGVPVIVVGNISVGGTGKTPLVIWLAEQLQSQGWTVGVILRGHGGTQRGVALVNPQSDPRQVGDEAVLIARRVGCAVAVGANRVKAAQLLVAQGVAVLVSDDGLQHQALRRDLEIAVIDGARGLGNAALLPLGPLREAPGRLQKVDAVVVNGADATGLAPSLLAPLFMTLVPGELRAVADDRPRSLATIRSAQVRAVAGIGNPARFFDQLRGLGCLPIEHAFVDHHKFRAPDLAFGDQLPIVMTEKDAVKCRSFATSNMWYLPVSATFSNADAAALLRQVQQVVSGLRGNHA